jgi:uncharacterized phage-associated protein
MQSDGRSQVLHNPKSIANFFLDLAASKGISLTPMKLQKLVYYAHGWFAGYTGQPLINESVEAWQYGPVIPSLYHEFKGYGSGPVKRKATDLATDSDEFEIREVPPPQDAGIRSFLEKIWASYGGYSAVQLSEMTHAADGPWDITWKECAGMRGTDIPFDRIQAHFKNVVQKIKHKAAAA